MTADLILAGLIKANLAATAAILVVLALRPLGRRLLGAKTAYALWLMVPAITLAAFAPAKYVAARDPSLETLALPPAQRAVDAFTGWASPVADQVLTLDLAALLLAAWLMGAAVLFGLTLLRSLRFAADPRVGPALIGVFKPKLVLPSDFNARFDADERRLVLAHEDTHRAARHPLINGLTEAVRCLCWFNPLIHIAAAQQRLDQELACDAAVVERHPQDRRLYAEALLKTQLAVAVVPLGCQWPPRTAPILKERIQMLATNTPGQTRRLIGVLIVGAATGLGAVAAWSAQPPRFAPGPVIAVVAMAGPNPFATPAPAPVQAAQAAQAAPATRPAPSAADRLKVGEVLSITVNMTGEDLTMPVPIDADGTIRGPDGSRIPAAGLTLDDVERAILSHPSAPPGVKVRVARHLAGVSLTNAGVSPAPLAASQPRTVKEAVTAGNAYTAMALGGTIDDAIAAMRAKILSDPRFLAQAPNIISDMASLVDTSDGSTLTDMGEADGVRRIARRSADGSSNAMIRLSPDGMFGVAASYPAPSSRPAP